MGHAEYAAGGVDFDNTVGCPFQEPEDVLSFGDRAIDMIAAKKAGIKAIACLWGTKEKSMLLGTAYDQAISSPLEILPYLQ